ncbi:MAG TPA: YdeI/OmpD-associated family protein [Vicinamibacterales bacterium]|nr:YdeI/OmpD-associated family protein [Vicinamibacterales bacterium]
MPLTDPRVDAYIDNAAQFAKPILIRLRRAIHKGCPEVTETLKWSVPTFEHHGILAGMAAFKAHCLFNVWKAPLVKAQLPKTAADALERIGRLESVNELPSDAVLLQIIRKAAAINQAGLKMPRVAKAPKPPARTPADLKAALAKKPTAATNFASMSPSHKREYIEWITDAKAAETRARRVAQTVIWVGEGKSRNWKYEK